MKGYCGNCKKVIDEVEIFRFNDLVVCYECYIKLKKDDDQEIDNDIIKWYILGCHIIQNPELNQFNKKKLKEFLETLILMIN